MQYLCCTSAKDSALLNKELLSCHFPFHLLFVNKTYLRYVVIKKSLHSLGTEISYFSLLTLRLRFAIIEIIKNIKHIH